nr:hypothetical protein [Nocardioides convexus]
MRNHAADPDLLHLLDPAPEERSWIRLLRTDDYELWLISWPAGAATDWHDHGSSSGAFTVLRGTLTEHRFDGGLQAHRPRRRRRQGLRRGLRPRRPQPHRPARALAARLLAAAVHHDPLPVPWRPPRGARRGAGGGGVVSALATVVPMHRPRYDGVDALLADARSRLDRVSAPAAFQEPGRRRSRDRRHPSRRPACRRGRGRLLAAAAGHRAQRARVALRPAQRGPHPRGVVRRPGDRAVPGGLHLLAGRRCAAEHRHPRRHRRRRRVRRLARGRTAGRRRRCLSPR